jgi:hypothetical protein
MLLMIGFHKNSQKLNTQKIRSINTVTELIQFFGSIARQKCLTLKCSIFTPPPVLASGGSVRSICWVGDGCSPKGARKSFSIATLITELFSHPTVSKNDRPFSATGSRFTIRWR